MGGPERQLRLVQIACILLLGACIFFSYFGLSKQYQARQGMSFGQGLILVTALWSGVSGFTVQRRITQAKPEHFSPKSTPLSRWKAGNFVRLSSATAVGLWGLVLQIFHGSLWLVEVFLAIGIILLATWRPGARPATR
jgi:hypothetical protein